MLQFLSVMAVCSASLAAGDNMASATLWARAEGADVRLAVQIEIEPGWHLFHGPTEADLGAGVAEEGLGLPTVIELDGVQVAWGDWRFPTPKTEHFDFGNPVDANIHGGTITIWRRGTLAPGAALKSLKASIKGLTCEEGEGAVCIPYKETVDLAGTGPDALFAAFPDDLTATPAGAPERGPGAARGPPGGSEGATKPIAAAGTAPRTADDDAEAGRESSLLAFLLSAVFWGFFTLLMPCTYPMIPITISYFTKQAAARKTSTLPLSLTYGAGIVGIFVLIGLLIGPIIIVFATHPVTNLVIGAAFLVFALSLFGVMNLQPPAFLMNAAGSASQKGGYLGVFLMGTTLVVTSFTCTAPFVGALLGQGAGQGDIGRIAIGMAVFGATIAIPFVFLSMVPHKAKSMPKSGEWMHTLKVWLGFVEVAAALKFLSNADLVWGWGWLSRELFLFLWMGVFLAAAAYLFGWMRLKDEFGQEEAATISPKRMVGGIATFLFSIYCLFGALGGSLDPVMTALAPNYSTTAGVGAAGGKTAAADAGHVIVKDDYDGALARAAREGKLLLVNFTGFT